MPNNRRLPTRPQLRNKPRAAMRALQRLLGVLALGLTLGAAGPAAAQLKVGFVNVPKVLDNAPQAKAADQRLEKEFGPRDSEILSMKRDLRKESDKLAKNAAIMSNTERQNKQSQLRQLQREIRRMEDEFNEDVRIARSRELSKLQRKVVEVIQTLAKAEKFDLIISDGVIFAGSKVDITEKVIGRLKNAK